MSPVDGMPAFVVIGAQKSASTFLQDQLAQHPEVDIAPGEVRCFEDPFYSPQAPTALPGLFQGAPTAVRGIKRPDLLGRPEAPARLARHLPQARLLAVLREPVARAVSAYYHYVRHGFAPLLPLDDAFDALLGDRLVETHPRTREILAYGRYGEHLSRYHEHFDRDRVLVFEQKGLVGDPLPALRRAFVFLGVDPGFEPDTTASVSNKGVYSPTRLRLLRSKNRVTHSYSPTLDLRTPRKPSPAGWLYNAGVVGLDRLVLSRFDSGRPPALGEDVRRRVEAYYAEDRGRLLEELSGSAVTAPWL